MILVTVGMSSSFKFNRLIKMLDQYANKIHEEVIMQIGCADYKPKNAKYFRYLQKEKMEELYKKARIVITHGGTGSIINALNYKKPVIVVPRMKRYGEASDDHQVELAQEFEKEKIIIAVYNIKELEKALKESNIKFLVTFKKMELISKLKEYIDNLGK